MRNLSTEYQNHLNEGVTTLCWCWKLTRTDNTVLGFTDHDVDVTVDGTTYEAQSGFTATAVDHDLGLSVPTMEVEGVLSSDNLTEEDLQAGLWDNATIELYRANWSDPTQYVMVRKGTVGEVSRNQHTFMAELRGLAYALNQALGRTYKYSCDAELGDSRCGVNLNGGLYTATGSVLQLLGHSRWFSSAELSNFPTQWFTGGALTWTTGANVGLTQGVRLFNNTTGTPQVELWFPLPYTIQAGDDFSIVVGCDKQFATCRHRFNNIKRFRGFPHMPDPSKIFTYPDVNAVHDGGSLYE